MEKGSALKERHSGQANKYASPRLGTHGPLTVWDQKDPEPFCVPEHSPNVLIHLGDLCLHRPYNCLP